MDVTRPRSKFSEHGVVNLGKTLAALGQHLKNVLRGVKKHTEMFQDYVERQRLVKQVTEFIHEHSLRRLVSQGGVEVRGIEENAPGQSIDLLTINFLHADEVIESVIFVENRVGSKPD
jgi:hypothetical protein